MGWRWHDSAGNNHVHDANVDLKGVGILVKIFLLASLAALGGAGVEDRSLAGDMHTSSTPSRSVDNDSSLEHKCSSSTMPVKEESRMEIFVKIYSYTWTVPKFYNHVCVIA